MKALIVEPSRFFASVLSGMLLKHGFEADIVASGEAGLEALAAQPYELLCFAFSLGDMNGITLSFWYPLRWSSPTMARTQTARRTLGSGCLCITTVPDLAPGRRPVPS